MHNSEESQAGAIDRLQGQPANVIAISPDPMPRDRVVAVPEGLRNIPAASHGNGDSGSSAAAHPEPAHQADAAAAQAAARPGNEPDGRAASQSAAAGGTGGPGGTVGAAVHSRPDGTASAEAAQSRNSGAAAPGKEPAPARAGREGGEAQSARNNAEGPGNRSHESNGTSPGMARRPELPLEPAAAGPGDVRPEKPALKGGVTRIQHPANGSFDVVVMQSSASEDLPEADGLLTGSPVYTVYLNVGAEREWLMRYCLPGRSAPQTARYEITAEETAPLSPPYPLATAIPNSLLKQAWTRHILLHGFLNANGKLRDMSAAEAGNAIARQVLELLGDWQFRPAMKQDKPVDVEILLAIPPRS
jgi:hypothetical protein